MRSLVGVWLLAASHFAAAATLYTANQGADSGTCGAAKTPCRSISQAIQNAAVGDTIVVGPGFYGDLDGNGVFGGAGEETAEIGTGCNCVVKVDKRLTLRSREGSGATVIDGGAQAISVVWIGSAGSNAVIGAPNAGFTVRNSQGAGVVVDAAVSGVRVAGNLAEANDSGGFLITGPGARVEANRAIDNAGGGFQFGGDDVIALNDVAEGNAQDGFVLFGLNGVVQHSVSSGNEGYGFTAVFSTSDFVADGALGNGLGGVLFDSASGSVSGSSLIGNGRAGGAANCGLENKSGLEVPAAGNYWGAATGPGADPADAVCNIGVGSTTIVTPFKAAEIKVHAKAQR